MERADFASIESQRRETGGVAGLTMKCNKNWFGSCKTRTSSYFWVPFTILLHHCLTLLLIGGCVYGEPYIPDCDTVAGIASPISPSGNGGGNKHSCGCNVLFSFKILIPLPLNPHFGFGGRTGRGSIPLHDLDLF
jgi:hypothetical protein